MPSLIRYAGRIIREAEYLALPWKNRLGVTTQIAIFPRLADFRADPFLWRVSMAPVLTDGKFSFFRGYDRIFMMLKGGGIRLLHEGHEEQLVDQPFVSRRFSGDWRTRGELVTGPIEDFNLMLLRGRVEGSLEVFRPSQRGEVHSLAGDHHLYTVVRGAISAMVGSAGQVFRLRAGETLHLTRVAARRGRRGLPARDEMTPALLRLRRVRGNALAIGVSVRHLS